MWRRLDFRLYQIFGGIRVLHLQGWGQQAFSEGPYLYTKLHGVIFLENTIFNCVYFKYFKSKEPGRPR